MQQVCPSLGVNTSLPEPRSNGRAASFGIVWAVRCADLGPHLRRITFRGPGLNDFVSLGFGDHVLLRLPYSDAEISVERAYSSRHFDEAAHELTIDFALLGTGPATRWARAVVPGSTVWLRGPRVSDMLAVDLPWNLLVGGETAIPAISRRLEEMSASSRAHVIVIVQDRHDLPVWHSKASFDVVQVSTGQAAIEAVRRWRPPVGVPCEGLAWCAGEADDVARIR